ncbi:hypothetical protein [Microvirga tunisiensis]|uniref:Uncharacterized protein n=1 Tax=Microvirga tunisiensis TaxID=2108360 RepID=A0A5N7MTI7_9HYPH|nr:hypothetical protein [Microvirga tunisiensis]MPR11363.1 hypothetical protein [Microvirga tunisiensis]MPR29404.1 hypothetical protein [Microvirga tunisiensis]
MRDETDVPAFHSNRTKSEHMDGLRDLKSVPLLSSKEMMMTDQVHPEGDVDPLEANVTAVIDACGGNPRTAIRALLIKHEILEQRIGRLASAISFGYVRGRAGTNPASHADR